MKTFAVFLTVALALVTADSCYKEVDGVCSQAVSKLQVTPDLLPCNATYGHIDLTMKHLVNFANSHIVKSFEYLLMSSYYGNYKTNREGFQKLFKGLSDSKWEKAIDIIKHITKRGGTMEFHPPTSSPNGVNKKSDAVYDLYEIQSVAKALDMEKQLALEAFDIHKGADQKSEGKHDPEVASYIEQEFVHQHAKTVRKLAGYVSDLKKMLSGPDGSLSLFLFDEYLKQE